MAFEGEVICITGKFSQTRGQIKKILEANGAKVVGSVTNACTILLAEGDEGSKKWNTAENKGIPIYDEAWMNEAIEGGGGSGGGGAKKKAPPKKKAAAKKKTSAKAKKGSKRKHDDIEDENEDDGGDAAGGAVFEGMTFAVTGKFTEKRADIERTIILNGGSIAKSVTKKVTHLLCEGDEGSAKYNKAEANGIPILDEAWFRDALESGVADETAEAEPPAKKTKTNAGKKKAAPKKKKAVVEEEEFEPEDEDEDMEDAEDEADDGDDDDSPAPTEGGASRFDSIPVKPISEVGKYSGANPKAINVPGPYFPKNYTIRRVATLQKTDIANNNNKYYCLECHVATENGKDYFRVYAHYGRTDEVANNPMSGVRQVRIEHSLDNVEALFAKVLKEKTRPNKYTEVNLLSANIGSELLRGRATGKLDKKTKAKVKSGGPKKKAKSQLSPQVQELVRYLFDESVDTLTKNVDVKITANGIETPLGILTVAQVETGEAILDEIATELNGKKRGSVLGQLSNQFYTTIPHKFGDSRARKHGQAAIINELEKLTAKRDMCQLMKDMLEVEGVLADDDIDNKYNALNCEINYLDKKSDEFKEIRDHVINSQLKTHGITVAHIYSLKRDGEYDNFRTDVPDVRMLFHGSRVSNWVGLLTRGILMPKQVVALGGKRTDGGWLGAGIYFGDTSCTSAFYTNAGKKGTRFMTVAEVSLGRICDFSKITYGLEEPPAGYDSCHGVRGTEFEDDEYVVYATNRQRLRYLVEFTTTDWTYFQ